MKKVNGIFKEEYEINKSRFISYLFSVETSFEAKEILKNIRKEYNDATHVCYAYIVNNETHSNDDGEPKGTAGVPILEVLKKNDITNTLCIVIRYFGGIKLGAGGVLRAYVQSSVKVIENSLFACERVIYKYNISLPYDKQNIIEKISDLFLTFNREFGDTISYDIKLLKENEGKFLDVITPHKEIVVKSKDEEVSFL